MSIVFSTRGRALGMKKKGKMMHTTEAHRKLAEKFMFKKLWKGVHVSDALIQLAALAYTEEEAEIVNALGFTAMPALAIARKLNRPVNEISPILISLAERLLIAHYEMKGINLYAFMQLIPGVYEMQMVLSKGRDDEFFKEFARLFKEYYEETMTWLKPQVEQRDIPFMRVIPIERSLESTSRFNIMALSTDKYSEMVDRNKSFCLIDPCPCRQEAIYNGEGCGKPLDVCSAMGWMADIAVEKGLARRVSKAEFMEAKMRAAEAGLVNMVDNLQDPIQVCSCCGCCCSGLKMLSKFNIPTIIAQSHFEAVVYKKDCIGCKTCVEVCPMKAITMKNKTARVDYTRCIGCGICVTKCDNNAVVLKGRPNYKPPAETGVEYILNRYFEIKGYENPILPRVSLGVGRLISKYVPFHISGPKYKP